jgi:hypothetical protein
MRFDFQAMWTVPQEISVIDIPPRMLLRERKIIKFKTEFSR